MHGATHDGGKKSCRQGPNGVEHRNLVAAVGCDHMVRMRHGEPRTVAFQFAGYGQSVADPYMSDELGMKKDQIDVVRAVMRVDAERLAWPLRPIDPRYFHAGREYAARRNHAACFGKRAVGSPIDHVFRQGEQKVDDPVAAGHLL